MRGPRFSGSGDVSSEGELARPRGSMPARTPSRSATRVYDLDPRVNWDVVEGDRYFRDSRFHHVSEIGDLSKVADFVEQVVAEGFAVDVVRDRVRLRLRGAGESRPSVLEVLDQIRRYEPKVVVSEAGESSGEPEGSGPDLVDVIGSGIGEERIRGGLVLSDPPDDLTLPAEVLPALAGVIFAMRGKGKTYLGGVFLEELLELPDGDRPTIVVVDPLGVWWGILATEAGMPSSYEVLVLGGEHGHASLSPGDGSKVSELVAQSGARAVVLDLSSFKIDDSYKFCADFFEGIIAWEKKVPLHIIIDEGDTLAPQSVMLKAEQRRCLAAVEWLVMRGRFRGTGILVITLRPSLLSINVRSQVDSMWLMGTTLPRDLSIIDGLLDNRASDQQRISCVSELPTLPKGTAYFLRGGDRPMFRRFKVRRKKTWDSSRTMTQVAERAPRLWRPPADVIGRVAEILGRSALGQ